MVTISPGTPAAFAELHRAVEKMGLTVSDMSAKEEMEGAEPIHAAGQGTVGYSRPYKPLRKVTFEVEAYVTDDVVWDEMRKSI